MNGEVMFLHAGQEIGPSPKEDSATFIVTDKALPRLMPYDSHKVSITILPQNTRPPRLYFKRAILVDEGKRSAVTEENLSASDDDTFPGELLIVITKQPEHGYLENLRPTPGHEKSGKNKRINAFPLQDVKSGFITFVQFFHRNIEPESDVFEVFVTDGVHNSTTVLVYVSIVLLNDEVPYVFVANISVNEGDAFIMDNDSISTSDRDYPGDILVISVKSKPKYGTLTHFVQAISNGPLLEIPFNQLAAENFESIVYRHDGSENFFDYFTLSVNDGVHTVLRTCFVEINPVNDESPVLKKNIAAERVEFLGSFTLSSAVLFSEDADSTPDEIYFEIISAPKFGVLERKGTDTQWKLLDSMKFSQTDINSNLIRYQHTSKLRTMHEDSFNFFLSDGVHNSSLASFVIKFSDDEKKGFSVLNNKASIDPGGELILNSSLLHILTNSSVDNISFVILRPPYYGSLSLKGDVLPVKNFTLFHLKNNLLLYLHNESHKFTNDSFDIMITNGVIMKNLTFNIAISSFIDKFPHLRVLLPLVIDMNNSSSFFITSEHLLASQSLIPSRNITYKIIEKPKFGSLMYYGKIENPLAFSQEDIDKGLITYVPKSNSSFTDHFLFEVASNQEDGYVRNESLTLDPSIFPIFVKNVDKVEDPVLVINRPGDLEEVWNQNVGFHINNYNLRVSFPAASPKDIKFVISKYLDHGYVFHLKEEKVVRSFTQEDVNEQLIIIILKQQAETSDYFTFQVVVNHTRYNKEYRMDFQWALVFFPYPEYSVCENEGILHINVHRVGNTDVSSYVTVTTLEQTAKKGLDFVSRNVNKIQFDPGKTLAVWEIIIVQDDLEEAPIEQLQVVLSDPENCLISSHNRTVVSIYDLNRGSCSQIPVPKPPVSKGNDASNPPKSSVSIDEDEECNEHIYGLLHYNRPSQNFFQCDGKNWLPWLPETSSNVENTKFSVPPFESDGKSSRDVVIKDSSVGILNSKESKAGLPSLEAENCFKGWEEFSGKCYKWNKLQSTWSDAQTTCESFPYGELVVVETPEHNDWLVQLARGKLYWIGLHASTETNEWSYRNHTHVRFFNWKKGFPRLSFNREIKHRCVLVRGSGLWINKNCDTQSHSFICAMPLYSESNQ
ncbi:FRAS1-related extracellular matrix protein 1-like isoform X2 [Stegodyphus dumicola]|uniref:FRAS1-related extracellular matrix protein 1-like isoform X2 n=1 Tax=Stegodyphus dumicola TaxID=202533 RepID=UPI0015A963D5|nr:FRAS1-related extracellular matrix protein 1-like isoform X2 [Stegodyphus dumicola]